MDLDLNQIEERLKTNLETVLDIDLAILFGSALRGKLRRDSDIDLAFYSKRNITLKEKIEYSLLLSRKLPLEIDLIDLHNAHGLLLNQILNGGKIIINKRPEICHNLVSRMIYEREDWLPIQRRIRLVHIRRFIGE